MRKAIILTIILVPLALIALLAGRTKLSGHRLELKAHFQDAQGLRAGAPVKIAGVEVGSVTSVRARSGPGQTAEVTMLLATPYELNIPDDSHASLRTAGVLGGTFVEIKTQAAKGPPARNGAVLSTTSSAVISTKEIVERLGKSSLCEQSAAPELITPEAVARRFCELDFQGLRLTSTCADPLWSLTSGEGEPPAEPVYIVSNFTLSSAVVSGNTAKVKVTYDVTGKFGQTSNGPSVTPFVKTVSTFVVLERTPTGWKIPLSQLRTSPHVSSQSLIRFLESVAADVESGDQPDVAHLQSVDRSIRALRSLRKH